MSGTSSRERAPIFGGLALLVTILAALQLAYPEPGMLYLAPALLLLAALAFDFYPGERLLAALARAWHPVIARERRRSPQSPLPPRSSPRGGVLLGLALAGRGPPA